MAIKNIRVSDLTGTELKDDDCIEILVRDHPKLDEPKRLDAASGELEALKVVKDLVRLEVRYPDGTTKEVSATVAELEKVIHLDILQDADGLRGRRRGFRPGAE